MPRRWGVLPRLALVVALTTQTGAADRIAQTGSETVTGWFCPMHPDQTSSQTGKCPVCGMALLPGNPYDFRDYALDFTTSPARIASQTPLTVTLKIGRPGSGEPVTHFEVVHEKLYHLFLVSQDETVFEHLHPELQTDGTWKLNVTLPKPGYYRVLSDFVPGGGAPQFLGRTLVTADFNGDLESQTAHLEPDTVLTKTVDSITATVAFEPFGPYPGTMIAGQFGHLQYTLVDAATGAPITDLEPYLGAFGHTLMLSEDLTDYVHSHPTEGPEHDISKGFGGPRITFEGFMPHAGKYRAWTQFLRRGHVTTVAFTFSVVTLAQAARAQP